MLHSPTLTEVLPSSSDALLPPALLPTLMRLLLRGGRIMPLMGLGGGDPGGELAIFLVVLRAIARVLVVVWLFEVGRKVEEGEPARKGRDVYMQCICRRMRDDDWMVGNETTARVAPYLSLLRGQQREPLLRGASGNSWKEYPAREKSSSHRCSWRMSS